MSTPRFQLLPAARVLPRQGDGDPAPLDGSVMWRLLGANNYELGRSTDRFAGMDEAHAAVEDVLGQFEQLVASIEATPSSGRWQWRLLVADQPIAMSSRSFQRERECRYNLGQFLAVAPSAVLHGHPRWAGVPT